MLSPFISRCLAVLRTYSPQWWGFVAIIFSLMFASLILEFDEGESTSDLVVLGLILLCILLINVLERLRTHLRSEGTLLLPGYFWPHILPLGLTLIIIYIYLFLCGLVLSLWVPGVLAMGLFVTGLLSIAWWMQSRTLWPKVIFASIFISFIFHQPRRWYGEALLLGGQPDAVWVVSLIGLVCLAMCVWQAKMLRPDSPDRGSPQMIRKELDNHGVLSWIRDRELIRLLKQPRRDRWWYMAITAAGHEPAVIERMRMAFYAVALSVITTFVVLLAKFWQPTIEGSPTLKIFQVQFVFIYACYRLLSVQLFMETEIVRPVERWEYGRFQFLGVCTSIGFIILFFEVLNAAFSLMLSLPIEYLTQQLYWSVVFVLPTCLAQLFLATWWMLLAQSRSHKLSAFIAGILAGLVLPGALLFFFLPSQAGQFFLNQILALTGSMVMILTLAVLVYRRWMSMDLV